MGKCACSDFAKVILSCAIDDTGDIIEYCRNKSIAYNLWFIFKIFPQKTVCNLQHSNNNDKQLKPAAAITSMVSDDRDC